MHIKFPAQKGVALAELGYGESLLVPCNGRTIQSVQSSIQPLYNRKGLVHAIFPAQGTVDSQRACAARAYHHRHASAGGR